MCVCACVCSCKHSFLAVSKLPLLLSPPLCLQNSYFSGSSVRSLGDVQEKVLTASSPGERAWAHACLALSNLSLLQLPPLRSSPLPMPALLDFLCPGSLRCICLRRCRLCLFCQCRCVHVWGCTYAQCDGRKDEWTATPEVPPGVQHRV